ncbi:MAG TPA: FxsB family cyclophane-forming radical SAM/SPASM peptide maturase [Actinocrinis sp.]|uniref:FxsB family cyclophane-forming radical SAM/SPASM peptide maturase n=1 Tax=Actinocrinis sp. TaxID=1920516 RepID=UPI002DDD5190|nr:FxsB family cyclophane-forming radical SAM/SPASM peptide maturase [Actinocrinis sp.]HEV2343492.1 FxsB family cyclophane-forming radical SAM/SPASM peptide maturase [Actinocrinis sp.]
MASSEMPFRQFVIKVHSRCDLACDHCYMYESADQSWRSRPRVIALETADLIGERVAHHARTHGLDSVKYVLHGGEPLLAGAQHLSAVIEKLCRPLDGVATVDLRIHTNGVLLDRGFCDLFASHGVSVGVSLDGDRAANDRHRRYANGRTSHPRVLEALALLRQPEYRHLYAGILCTVDIMNDPVAVYDALKAEEPPRIDLLLPHATWDSPPPRPLEPETGLPQSTAYADWLIRIHQRWMRDGKPFGIRIFDSVSSMLAGGPSQTEAIGLEPSDLLVIETDGSIEQVDSLKVAFEGAPATGMSVLHNDLDAASDHPGMMSRRRGLDGLSAQCRACPVVTTCGGGYYPHRYRSSNGFDNSSVYCADLLHLIEYIARTERAVTLEGAPRQPVSISAGSLRELETGFGGAAAVAELVQAQASINRLLLAEAGIRAASHNAHARVAWQSLLALDATAPAELAVTLTHPYFRAWAAKIIAGATDSSVAGHLAAFALTATSRAGSEAELTIPVRSGAVNLPGLGRFLIDEGMREVRVRTAPDRLSFNVGRTLWTVPTDSTVELPKAVEERWQPITMLNSRGFAARIEDTDPERDCHQWQVSDRLSQAARVAWQDRFDTAWRLILDDHAAYAPGLAAGLTTITPLAAHPDGHKVSAAARQAFGAVGMALPDRADLFALLLIHEFQHAKFGAVLDLYDLYDESDSKLYYAPWCNDPRPLGGLLQGTYAHVAVTDFWRVRRQLDTGSEAAAAEIQFARWRSQTTDAVDALAANGSLTPAGRAFIEGIRATLTLWLAEPVSPSAEVAADLRARQHRQTYVSAVQRATTA